MNRSLRPVVALLFAGLSAPVLAQQTHDPLAMGKMWTFEAPPLAYLEAEYGFAPDQAWFDSLRLSALRLGERERSWCSASFVSPKGLIMTNHHCVREPVVNFQPRGKDWVKNGFAATSLEDEVRLPGLTVQQLLSQTDITDRMREGIEAGDDALTVKSKREANEKAILEAFDSTHPERLHQVVALYQGAVHMLYTYRVYDDLRLVCAVDFQTANFGGYPDFFVFPQWSIDFAFVRAYENGEPADTSAHYFRWREEGVKENELVFVPGNPGSTNRLMTMAQLEVLRDVEYPIVIEQFENARKILTPFAARSPQILNFLFQCENNRKAFGGMLDGLRDERLLAKKRAHEAHFRGAIEGKPEWKEEYGEVWDELATLAERRRAVIAKSRFYTASYCRTIDRAVAMAKALDETLPEEQRQAARMTALRMPVQGNPLTGMLTIDHFERALKWLGRRDPYVDAVASAPATDGPLVWSESIAAVEKSKLSSAEFVKELLEAEDAAQRFAKSEDPGIRVGRVLWPLMRAAQHESEAIESAIAIQGTRIGRALHEVYGSGTSPDATMTLRFSDGRALGYAFNGTLAPFATTLYGMYDRAAGFGGEFPFNLSQPWIDAEPRLDLSKRVCFASTNDIVGGNSGSAVVDQEQRVVGLVFDGNMESLPVDFYYTQEVARAVNVHTEAIEQALQHVYGMGWILEELRAGGR